MPIQKEDKITKIGHVYHPVGSSPSSAMPMREIEQRMNSLNNSLDRLRDSVITLRQNLSTVLTPEVEQINAAKELRGAETVHGKSLLDMECQSDRLDELIQDLITRLAL